MTGRQEAVQEAEQCLTRYSDTMNGHSPATPEPDTPDYVPSLTHQQLHIQHSAVWCLIICRLGRLYGHAYFFALLIMGEIVAQK